MGPVMTSRQAAEFDFALERNGATAADVKKLSSGDLIAHLLPIIRAYGETAAIAMAHTFLSPNGNIDLPQSAGVFDPAKFYQTRTGLYVWEGFNKRILAATKPVRSTTARSIAAFDLIKGANDAEIQGELPERHVFEDASVFCADLAGMINRQPKGEEGSLLSNGFANIFYVRGINSVVFTVNVGWYFGDQKWNVFALPRDVIRWDAGIRAFSSNCC